MGNFIHWDWGKNYPFSACMKKLMECLDGDPALYTYGFFAGISGDDFVMCYGNNGRYNDCVSVCEDTETFLARTFGRIGLAYELAHPTQWRQDPVLALLDRNEALWRELEQLGAGLNVTLEALRNPDTRREAIGILRRFIPLNQQMERELAPV